MNGLRKRAVNGLADATARTQGTRLAPDQEISKSQARRMVENGASEFAGQKITDPNTQVAADAEAEFRAGRHRKGDRVKQPLVARITAEPDRTRRRVHP